MKKINYKLLIFIFSGMGMNFGFSQTETTLSFFDNVYQSTYYSPFNKSDFKVSLGLPGISSIYGDVYNSGFSVRDIFPNGNVTDTIRPSQFIDGLKKKESIDFRTQVDLFHLYIQQNSHGFSFNITENVLTKFSYATDPLRFAWEGNDQFVGKTADFSGFGLDFMHYREYALGYYRNLEKWQFGGKAKLLFGKLAISTPKSDLKIDISDDVYQHKASGDFQVNIGGFDQSFLDDSTLSDADKEELMKNYILNSKNRGFALDLGASYQFNDKLQFNAALTNVGFINWKESTNNYTYNEQVAFEGVDVFEILFNNDIDSLDKAFEKYFDDEFPDSVDIDTTQKTFRTSTPWNFSLGGRYEFYKGTYAVGRFNLAGHNGVRPAFTFGVYHDFFRWFNIGVTNTVGYGKFFNPGLGVVLKGGPVQFYVVTDNLNAARFLSAQRMNARFGINLVFGKLKQQEKISSVVK
jgi:hypothetical protein